MNFLAYYHALLISISISKVFLLEVAFIRGEGVRLGDIV